MNSPRQGLSPVQAALAGWLSVALWNAGDIAQLPLRTGAARALHHAIDFGHVLAVALATALGIGLRARFRRRLASTAVVAVFAGALGPVVLSGDLEGALERLLPEHASPWLSFVVCVAASQVVTACFALGRLGARASVRWFPTASGLALVALHAVVLKNGYPGVHVLLSACGATLVAASQSGAERPRLVTLAARLAESPWRRRAVIVVAASASAAAVAFPPPNAVQLELLERDTPLLFPWLRPLYPSPKGSAVTVPAELRRWFQSRTRRPELPPSPERWLGEGPIVVMITIDALRADVLEPRRRRAAPNLHAMREHSIYFAQARSTASDTRYSMATLFSGVHLSMLKWTSHGGRKVTLERDRRPRLPEILRKAGVDTASVKTVSMMDPRLGIVGRFGEDLRRSPRTSDAGSPSDRVAQSIIARLKKQGPGPLFVYTHLMDPHDPYETYGERVKSEFEAYLLEVSRADAALGRIRDAIAELGLKERTALIVSADHGEGFGEHRLFTHGKALYDVMVRVPMLIELPGAAPRTVNDFVSLMDLGPTVLDLFGVPTPGSWMAESLAPFLAGKRGDPTRMILMEKPSHAALLFSDGLKVMKRRGAYELYDVRRDPEENDNLWEQRGDEGPRRLALLEAYLRVHSGNGSPADDDGDDSESE
jgi:hypothetical protein